MSTRAFRLELDSETDPIRGRLLEESGFGIAFVGWLGLASALERALETNGGGPAETQEDS